MGRHLACFACAAQAIALLAQPSPDKPIDITGTVINSLTGQPIADALVVLDPGVQMEVSRGGPQAAEYRPPLRQEPQRSLTDIAGKFTFRTPAAGGNLRISHRGYRSEANSDVARVYLSGAAPVNVKLVPLGVFEGRVFNGDGEPLPGVTVEAVRIQVRDGLREFQAAAAKTTDDLGKYRLWYLSPGSYYLKVVGRRGTINALAAVPQALQSDEAYGPVYFPNAASQEGAQTFRLWPGETVNTDFTVDGRPAYRIRGRLSSPVPNRRILVRLLRGDDPMGNRASVNLSSGAFEVFDVTPGTYTLQAYTNDASGLLFGETTVSVEKRDLTGVEVPFTPGVEVVGTVQSLEGDPPRATVTADYAGSRRLPAGVPSKSSVTLDQGGRFTFPHLWPGCYQLSFEIGGEEYASSAISGTADVLNACLAVGAISPAAIQVQLTKGKGWINGKVTGLDSGETATIVAIRTTGDVRPSLAYVVSDSTFYRQLPPGEYVLYAFHESQQFEYRSRAALANFSNYGTPLSVQPGGRHTVTVQVLPKGQN